MKNLGLQLGFQSLRIVSVSYTDLVFSSWTINSAEGKNDPIICNIHHKLRFMQMKLLNLLLILLLKKDNNS